MTPLSIRALLDSAVAQRQAGNLKDAEAMLRQALTLQPHDAQALYLLAGLLGSTGRSADAAAGCRQALKIQPDFAEASMELAEVLGAMDQWDEAAAVLHQAAQRHPDHPQILNRLGTALLAMRDMEQAVTVLRASAHLQANPWTWTCLGAALRSLGRHAESIASYDRALAIDPNYAPAFSSRLYALHFDPHADPAAIFREHRQWNQRYAKPLAGEIRPHDNDPSPDRRLKIGYVSPDFHAHSVSTFFESLLASHDPAHVETFCYAEVHRPDAITARLRQLAGQWRDILGTSDADVAQLIRRDQIDILVDLTGHTPNNRLLVFARKPAPIGVSYLGYPDTSGLDAIDYRLTDAHVDPPGESDRFFTERLIRLPHTFACYRPPSAPPVAPSPAVRNGWITFGSFSALEKLNAPLLECWAQILRQIPESRLLIVSRGLQSPQTRQNVADALARQGIGGDRLKLLGDQPMSRYLALHGEVDLVLDTFPLNGHTVTCHALWMGAAVVCLRGKTSWQRLGAAVLSHLDLPQFIADTPQQYVQLAIQHAGKPGELARWRAALRPRMKESPLMDGPSLARHIESAYRDMWRTWCQKRN
ncbi:MAG: tetratricopeptide repeat protein [Tepidisphaeraceae bacterium]